MAGISKFHRWGKTLDEICDTFNPDTCDDTFKAFLVKLSDYKDDTEKIVFNDVSDAQNLYFVDFTKVEALSETDDGISTGWCSGYLTDYTFTSAKTPIKLAYEVVRPFNGTESRLTAATVFSPDTSNDNGPTAYYWWTPNDSGIGGKVYYSTTSSTDGVVISSCPIIFVQMVGAGGGGGGASIDDSSFLENWYDEVYSGGGGGSGAYCHVAIDLSITGPIKIEVGAGGSAGAFYADDQDEHPAEEDRPGKPGGNTKVTFINHSDNYIECNGGSGGTHGHYGFKDGTTITEPDCKGGAGGEVSYDITDVIEGVFIGTKLNGKAGGDGVYTTQINHIKNGTHGESYSSTDTISGFGIVNDIQVIPKEENPAVSFGQGSSSSKYSVAEGTIANGGGGGGSVLGEYSSTTSNYGCGGAGGSAKSVNSDNFKEDAKDGKNGVALVIYG